MKKFSFLKRLALVLSLAFNASLALAFDWECEGEELRSNFTAAAETLNQTGDLDLDNDTKLALYAWYKQGSVGNKPKDLKASLFDPKRAAMYKAWEALQGMSQDDAKREYIKKANELLEL